MRKTKCWWKWVNYTFFFVILLTILFRLAIVVFAIGLWNARGSFGEPISATNPTSRNGWYSYFCGFCEWNPYCDLWEVQVGGVNQNCIIVLSLNWQLVILVLPWSLWLIIWTYSLKTSMSQTVHASVYLHLRLRPVLVCKSVRIILHYIACPNSFQMHLYYSPQPFPVASFTFSC